MRHPHSVGWYRSLASGLASALLALSTTVALGSFSSDLPLQHDPAHASVPGPRGANLAGDRVVIGTEYLPRRTDLPNKLIVPAGQVVELAADASYDYIEVAGTLRVSRAHDTFTRFTHLVILHGGTLDVGTQADPIPCERKVDFVIRDVPIDTTKDPFQWGNGLVNFGRQTRVGCSKTAWVESAGSIASGTDAIMLASSPSGWQVGDELLIPDTAAPSTSTLAPRRESRVTISAINGTQLNLSKPLDFAHENITDPNGVVVLRPRVANLTRNIVVRSENPSGTPGHTADVGHTAAWDIRFNQLIGLGRTRQAPFDDTVVGGRIGTNQRGKYAEHHHHVQSAAGSSEVGNVYIGHPRGKWGLVVHQTSDTLVERNIAIDFPGAAFVTEDGYEVRNVFRNNFAAYNLGRARDDQGNFLNAKQNVARECPGCEGTGFWLRGVMNAFEGNEAWNNFTSGMNLFNQSQPAGRYPSARGGEPDTSLKQAVDQPLAMTANVLAANVSDGVEVWAVKRFPHKNVIAAHNGHRQAVVFSSEGVELYLQNPKLICSVGSGAIGVSSSVAYVNSFEIDQGGQIAGCAVGIGSGGGASGMKLTGTVLQNEINIDLLPRSGRFENVMHVPLANHAHQYILFGNGTVWNGTDPLPRIGVSFWDQQRGSQYVVKNWQGTGKDYLLFQRQSLGSNPAWYSAPPPHNFNTPVSGLTMQQSWDKYGLSFGGDMLKESDAVQLDGVVNGLAREGLRVNAGPPRAIVTFPTMRENAIVSGGVVKISALLTGDPNSASGVMMLSVDGDRPYAHDLGGTDDRTFTTTHVSPGVHEVKVWRTQKANPTVAIPGSEYTSQYCVGSCPTIPHARITLSPDRLSFTTSSEGTAPPTRTITLSNSGVVELNWVVKTDQNWCKVGPYSGSVATGGTATLTVSASPPSNNGSSVCTVTVLDNNADNSPQTITVNYALSASLNR
jgi:Viral BACON domain